MDGSNILRMAAPLRLFPTVVALMITGTALAALQTPPPQQQQQQQQQQGRGQGQGRAGAQGPGQGGGQGGGRQGAAGQPARDNTQPPQTGTGGISGTVVLADSSRPVRRARVTLNGAEVRVTKTTVSDDQGNFTFSELPAGRYTLSASKPGYVNATYGQKKPGRPGTQIQLIDTQKLTNLKLPLPKGGVLTGVVLDENGEPTPGTQVTAFRYEMRTGQKQLTQAGNDQTDDRGMYRIYGLLPGDYVVRATPRNRLNDLVQVVQDVAQSLTGRAAGPGGGAGGPGGGRGGAGAGLQQMLGGGGLQQLIGGRGGGQGLQGLLGTLANPDEANVGYAPVYYPGTTTSTSASPITLGVSEERQGLDFQLQLVNTATVSGTVLSPDGDTSGVFLTLVNETEQALGTNLNTARVQQDGTFTFNNVAPGQYMVQARGGGRGGRGGGRGGQGPGGQGGQAAPEPLWGQTPVSVDGRPITGVAVSLQPGMKVNGHLVFEGGAPPTDFTRVRVALSPTATGNGADLAQNAPAQLDATGHFSISGVAPGRYTIRVQGGVQTYTLRSAFVGNKDILDFPLDVKPNEDVPDITLTMTTKTQELSGTLTDAQNQPASAYSVIVYSADPQYWLPQARRIASARPGTDGKFTFRNLPPGEYLIAAVTDVEPGEWFDPEFLQQLRAASARVTLADGDRKTQDLRLGGG